MKTPARVFSLAALHSQSAGAASSSPSSSSSSSSWSVWLCSLRIKYGWTLVNGQMFVLSVLLASFQLSDTLCFFWTLRSRLRRGPGHVTAVESSVSNCSSQQIRCCLATAFIKQTVKVLRVLQISYFEGQRFTLLIVGRPEQQRALFTVKPSDCNWSRMFSFLPSAAVETA